MGSGPEVVLRAKDGDVPEFGDARVEQPSSGHECRSEHNRWQRVPSGARMISGVVTLAWGSAKTLHRLAGMDPERKAIVPGGPSSDRLVISDIRWAFPGAAIEFDRTMLEARFELDSGPWHVIVKGQFPESHLSGLKSGLEVLYRDLVGSASLATWEPPLVSFDLDGDGKRRIQLSGEIWEGPILENRLKFTLPASACPFRPRLRMTCPGAME
jgi:hypothetical protein